MVAEPLHEVHMEPGLSSCKTSAEDMSSGLHPVEGRNGEGISTGVGDSPNSTALPDGYALFASSIDFTLSDSVDEDTLFS
ncbi:MAG: hypothetical protein QGG26_15325, partial [Candidatus Undinarchaeales archaeon]|nr:hypothetical protein [Candidatus Undinarchaeales archaeon]